MIAAVAELGPWDAIALLSRMPPAHPQLERAVGAFVVLASEAGWNAHAIDCVLQRHGFAYETRAA